MPLYRQLQRKYGFNQELCEFGFGLAMRNGKSVIFLER